MYSLIMQIYFCQIIHIVVEFWLDEIMGYHRVEHLSLYLYTIVHQYLIIVLDVLSHFHDFWILIEWFKDVYEF